MAEPIEAASATSRRVLITGGGGFIGANLARRLVREGHEVHLLLRPQTDPWRLADIGRRLQSHPLGLRDAPAVATCVRTVRPEWVFHLAAYGAYAHQADAARMVATNVAGTLNLIEACRAYPPEAFVHAGTSSEYGYSDHPARETDRLAPNSYYAVTKAAATLMCRHAAIAHGLPIRTLRIYSAYGPFEAPDRLIPRLTVLALSGRLPPLVDPDVARDFVFIDDVTEGLILAARSAPDPGAIFNLGSGVQTTIRQVIDLVCRLLPVHQAPQWGTMANRQWDTTCWLADNTRIRQSLGWQPTTSLESGLKRMIAWFQQRPEMLAYYRQKIDGA